LTPNSFEYASPKSLPEAIELLRAGGDGAKLLAGGQSLIPLMKLRLASPTLIVDLNRVPGLEYITESSGFLRLGALTRMADVADSELLRQNYHILHDVSSVIADPLVRNLGTVGGNVSHGDPANDFPAAMLALRAEFAAAGPSGERTVKADDFFLGTLTTALSHDEILTEIRLPTPPPLSGGSYLKLERGVSHFATVGAGVQVTINPRGECESAGIGLTAVGPTPLRAKEAEEVLRGKALSDGRAVDEAARVAAGASDPMSDIRGTAGYKKGLVRLAVSSCIRKAYQRAHARRGR
jgi:aerobic carbon-monoxide dehydrogenase medium subunit